MLPYRSSVGGEGSPRRENWAKKNQMCQIRKQQVLPPLHLLLPLLSWFLPPHHLPPFPAGSAGTSKPGVEASAPRCRWQAP